MVPALPRGNCSDGRRGEEQRSKVTTGVLHRHPAGRPSFGLRLRRGLSQDCPRRRPGESDVDSGCLCWRPSLESKPGAPFPFQHCLCLFPRAWDTAIWGTKGRFGLGLGPPGNTRAGCVPGTRAAHIQDSVGVVSMGTNWPTSEFQGTDALPQIGSDPRNRAWPPLGEVHTCSPIPGSWDTPPGPHHLQAWRRACKPGLSQGHRRGGALPGNLMAPASPKRRQTVRDHGATTFFYWAAWSSSDL